jgi:hypothetical protein
MGFTIRRIKIQAIKPETISEVTAEMIRARLKEAVKASVTCAWAA